MGAFAWRCAWRPVVWLLAASTVVGALLPVTSARADEQIRVVYRKPSSQKYLEVATVLQQQRFLDVGASVIKSNVYLPGVLTLVAEECGQVNAFYKAQSRSIHMCYELLQDVFEGAIQESKQRGSNEDAKRNAAGAIMFVFFHELGHAIVHILNVPYFGKQEDVADQIATYLALHSPDPKTNAMVILGGHWYFRNKGSVYVKQHLADTHSLGEQRQFNIVCWAYGSNPQRYIAVAQSAQLPKKRAVSCPNEYGDLDRAVRRLFGSNLRGQAAGRA